MPAGTSFTHQRYDDLQWYIAAQASQFCLAAKGGTAVGSHTSTAQKMAIDKQGAWHYHSRKTWQG